MGETFYGKFELTEKDKKAAEKFQGKLENAKSTNDVMKEAHNLEFETMRDQEGLARKKKDSGVDKEDEV